MFLYLKWKNIMINKSFLIDNMKNKENNGFDIFSSIICCIEIIFSSLLFCTLIYYKKKLSHIDLLIIGKNIFLALIFSLFLLFSIHKQIYEIDIEYNYSTSTLSIFYISLMYNLQIAINIEQFKSIRNPCYVVKYMINKSYKIYYHILISFIISLIITILPYFFQKRLNNIYDYFFSLTENDYFDVTITKNAILTPFIIINFFVLLYLYFKIKLFYQNLKEKSLLHLKYTNLCLLITNSFYFAFGLILLFIPLFQKVANISKIIQVLFFFLSISDSYLFIFKIFLSGFYYYYLNETFIGFIIRCLCGFGCFFDNVSFPKDSNLIASMTTKHTKSIYSFYSYIDYVLEDYILDTLDFILHATTAGLSIVYKNMEEKTYHFKSKNDFLSIESANTNNNLTSDNDNSDNYMNTILNINDIGSDTNENNEEDDNSNLNSTYNFFKLNSKSMLIDKLDNDLFSFSYCGNANIFITPLYVNESIETINIYKVNKYDIINSLLSHKFLSLLMTNSKRIFFKKLNNLIFKTYDNKLLIELHTDINSNNVDFNDLIKRYFNHINYENINSFLCVLLGIFKIKINNLKEILIFVSKNPFVENVPRDFYNYWELLRFVIDKKKFHKVLSSKDRDSFVISSRQESFISGGNNKNNIFQLEDYQIFHDTIKNDIEFLSSIFSCDFSLLLLYYEFETNKNLSKESKFINIKNKNTSESNLDLLKVKLNNNDSSLNFSPDINYSSNSNNMQDHINIIPSGNMFDTDKEVIITGESKKKIDEMSDIPLYSNDSKSLIMKNGFEANFNNYKGIVYFRWDNVFYQKKKGLKETFFSDYHNEVIKYFST